MLKALNFDILICRLLCSRFILVVLNYYYFIHNIYFLGWDHVTQTPNIIIITCFLCFITLIVHQFFMSTEIKSFDCFQQQMALTPNKTQAWLRSCKGRLGEMNRKGGSRHIAVTSFYFEKRKLIMLKQEVRIKPRLA